MDFRPFQVYKPGASRYNGRISEDEWNRHKPKLRELHEAKLTRQQILEIISKDFGDTKPTYGQLCTKFDKWGFHVYRQNERKDTAAGGKKAQRKNTKTEQQDLAPPQALSPESSNGSTVVPDMGGLDINDKSTPMTFGTPQTQFLDPSNWSDTTPRANHSRNASDQTSTPPLTTIYEPDPNQQYLEPGQYEYANGGQTQEWISATSLSNTDPSRGNRSSYSDTLSSRTSIYQTTTELSNIEPDDPVIIAARTQKADDALDAVTAYLRSTAGKDITGDHIQTMISLAAYLFATRSYGVAFRIYRKVYEIMCQDMGCNDVSKVGALMRCYQSAIEPEDLEFMAKELHEVLEWNFSDSSIGACVASMLQTIEAQISEGLNHVHGSVLSTSSITRNLSQLMAKGTGSDYPGTRRLYWRLRLLKHSPFHSGCKRLLRLMSELLSWAWAAMAVVKFPEPAVQTPGCLCKDGLYFDFVRMVTTVILEAALGFDISQLIKLSSIKESTACDCVMCADLETTFEICAIETFTSIALLTVDRCRLDWTSCHPGGRHQELTPQMILKEQLLPTADSLLDQVAADLRLLNTIHTSDLYDDFLSCIWSTFETHDLPLKNSRFDASFNKVEDMMTMLTTDELNKSHPARNSTIEDDSSVHNGKMPVLAPNEHGNEELANKISAKRTRSNASSLKPSSSNASERSMIRIRKKLKFRTSADYLNSMSSYSSLSSRNSMNRFSLVTGLPELETTMEDEEFDPRNLPPDLTPDEYRSMQRHDSWSRRSDHFSWVPSRPGSTASRSMSWRESANGYSASRPGSVSHNNGLGKRASQKEVVSNPSHQVMQNQIQGVERALGQQQQQQAYAQSQMLQRQLSLNNNNQAAYQQNYQHYPPNTHYQTSNNQTALLQMSQPQHSQLQPPMQPPMTQPVQPIRKNSAKSTKSKDSTKGRWSSEAERVERILRMTQ